MRIPALAAVLTLLAPSATMLTTAGCFPLICDDVLYDSGLHVDIEIPNTPAMYRVEVEAEGEVLALEYDVMASGAACLHECTAIGQRLQLRDTFPSDLTGLGVTIVHLGDQSGPETATVRVFRGGTLVAEDTFEPHYETDEPNGRGCGERDLATETLIVP